MKKLSNFLVLSQNAYFSAILSAVLIATSYPPFPAWALFFALVPLMVSWHRAPTAKQILLTGFVCQFVFVFIGFNWIAHTAREYGHLPWALSILVLIGFCCIASLHVPIAGYIAYKINRRWPLTPGWFFTLLASLLVAGEWFFPMIFPWNFGYPLLFSHFKSSQLAEFIGFNGLSFLVLLSNAAFATAFVKYPKPGWSRSVIVFVFLLFCAESIGTYVEKNLGLEDKTLHALLIQPNIGNYDKFLAERGAGYQEPVVRKYFDLTIEGLAKSALKPDIIVWPETAYPASLDPGLQDGFYQRRIFDFVKAQAIPMLIGAYSEDPGDNNNKSYNAVFAIDQTGTAKPGYRKNILLAFGEYFPGAQYFPFLKDLIPEISDFGRGAGPMVFQLNNTSFSPLICYEGLDVSFVGKTAKLGVQIFVNVTNDSWFGKSFEPYQHMIMTIARTIEFRRPMIRSTNTGFSVIADARGHILAKGPQDTEWAQTVDVPYFSQVKNTFFSKILDFIPFIFLILPFLITLIGRYVGKSQRT
ncbi:MAG: apolipoprotein N-acyltransferase [Oligoflexia bacterium]|nr:apolipoprotein N-acyltransferase [Oligoflexia bacterium]